MSTVEEKIEQFNIINSLEEKIGYLLGYLNIFGYDNMKYETYQELFRFLENLIPMEKYWEENQYKVEILENRR